MANNIIEVEMIQASDTYTNWVSSNPILKQGRISYDTTNKKIKIGDGITSWVNLPYIDDVIDGGTY